MSQLQQHQIDDEDDDLGDSQMNEAQSRTPSPDLTRPPPQRDQRRQFSSSQHSQFAQRQDSVPPNMPSFPLSQSQQQSQQSQYANFSGGVNQNRSQSMSPEAARLDQMHQKLAAKYKKFVKMQKERKQRKQREAMMIDQQNDVNNNAAGNDESTASFRSSVGPMDNQQQSQGQSQKDEEEDDSEWLPGADQSGNEQSDDLDIIDEEEEEDALDADLDPGIDGKTDVEGAQDYQNIIDPQQRLSQNSDDRIWGSALQQRKRKKKKKRFDNSHNKNKKRPVNNAFLFGSNDLSNINDTVNNDNNNNIDWAAEENNPRWSDDDDVDVDNDDDEDDDDGDEKKNDDNNKPKTRSRHWHLTFSAMLNQTAKTLNLNPGNVEEYQRLVKTTKDWFPTAQNLAKQVYNAYNDLFPTNKIEFITVLFEEHNNGCVSGDIHAHCYIYWKKVAAITSYKKLIIRGYLQPYEKKYDMQV